MNSCIYEGTIRHRRFRPKTHEFKYSMYMLYLDLEELDRVFRGRVLWSATRPAVARFRRDDYLGDPDLPLAEAVRQEVMASSSREITGPIRLLTHLRYFGYCFNPASFYYCFDKTDSHLEAIVAEITNTPWNERHAYVLTESLNVGSRQLKQYVFEKSFHVSPFIDMDQEYRWYFALPGVALSVYMENVTEQGKLFDATLNLKRKPLTARNLNLQLLRHPFMTGKVIGAIYWNALKLWLKRCPFYTHPAKSEEELEVES